MALGGLGQACEGLGVYPRLRSIGSQDIIDPNIPQNPTLSSSFVQHCKTADL